MKKKNVVDTIDEDVDVVVRVVVDVPVTVLISIDVKRKSVVMENVRVEVRDTVVSIIEIAVWVAVEIVVEKRKLRQVEVSVANTVSVKQHTQLSQGHSLPQIPPAQLLLQRGLEAGGGGTIPRHLGQAVSQHITGGGGPQQPTHGQD